MMHSERCPSYCVRRRRNVVYAMLILRGTHNHTVVEAVDNTKQLAGGHYTPCHLEPVETSKENIDE